MSQLRLEWNEEKNRSNQRKHGVSFEEAAQVFRHSRHFSVQDRVVNGEERWQTFGLGGAVVLLMTAHTMQEEDTASTVVRIISARKATPTERRRYEDENA